MKNTKLFWFIGITGLILTALLTVAGLYIWMFAIVPVVLSVFRGMIK